MNIRLITLTLISTVASHCIANPSEATIRQRLKEEQALEQIRKSSNKMRSDLPTMKESLIESILDCMNKGIDPQECFCAVSIGSLTDYRHHNDRVIIQKIEPEFRRTQQKIAQLIFNPEN